MKIFTRLLLLLFLFPLSSRSWHIIGGEMYYTCLGNNNYEITLKIYRDCNSTTPFDAPAYVSIYRPNGVLHETLLIPLPGFTTVEPDLTNPCLQIPPGVCVEEAIYKAIYNLPPIAGGYDIAYQRCCRNNTIVNLNDPANTGATFTAHIPSSSLVSCNSSPRFTNYPPIVICVDQVLEFDHSATDPNGDSLVYSLCTPYQGADAILPQPNPPPPPPYDPVVWLPPYNLNNQIGGSPVMSIDPVTGLLTGFPTALGQYVVGVCVMEYRNGVFLSQDVRDFQFNITTCNPLIEANFNVNGGVSINDTLLLCGTNSASFNNLSYGSTIFEWDFGVTGITTDVSTEKNPVYVFPDTGVYKVMLYASPGLLCGDSVFKYVEVRKGVTPDFTVTPECMLTPVDFTDASVPLDGYLSGWAWDFGDGTTNTQQDPQHAFTNSGTFNVNLLVSNNYGCTGTITKPLIIHPLPDIQAGPDTFVCDVDMVTLYANDGISYAWSPAAYVNDPSLPDPLVNPPVTTVYTVTVTNVFGCIAKDSVTIQVTDTVIANTIPDASICIGDSIQLSTSNAVQYLWSPDYKINNTFIPNPVVNPEVTTTYYVVASVGSCIDEDTVTITVLLPPDVDAGEDITINQGETAQLNVTGSGSYQWIPPDDLSDPFISNPVASPINTVTYSVNVTADNGCKATDSVTVIVTHYHLFLVPNAFTPNGDGLNDYFQFYTKGIREVESVKVFNRWGQMVYSDEDGNDEGWDGSFLEVPCEVGTYIFYISGITYDNNPLQQKGNLTLLR